VSQAASNLGIGTVLFDRVDCRLAAVWSDLSFFLRGRLAFEKYEQGSSQVWFAIGGGLAACLPGRLLA